MTSTPPDQGTSPPFSALVRAATETDLPQVRALMNRIIRDTTITFTDLQKSLPDMHTLFNKARSEQRPFLVLSTADGTIVGYATYGPFRAGPGYAHVGEHSINLAPHVHRAGLGRQLLEALETRARRNGVSIMVAGVSAANPPGLAFHRAMGYREVGYMPGAGRKFGHALDLVLLQKSL